jgi:archaemetzincin
MKKSLLLLLIWIGIFPVSLFGQETADFEKIVPLYEQKKESGPFDWLAQHEEKGQTFSDFLSLGYPVPDDKKPYLYIALLGDFTDEQKKVLTMASRYIAIYFQTPVKFTEPIALSVISASARRTHPTQGVPNGQTGDPQILSTYVIEEILKPRMPKDAFAFIAFTSSDLWPGEGWNFVFGQASMDDRIGVWSIYRNGDIKKDFQLYLRRTIQTGTHEIGHLFGLDHCIYYECNMNGSNSRAESDRRPLWDCPVCLRKLSTGIKFDVVKRFRELISICREFDLVPEAEFFEKNLRILEKK